MCGSNGLLALHAVTILLSVSNHSHRHVGPVRLRYGRNLHSTPRTAGSAARPYVIVTPGLWLAGRRHARPLRTVWCALRLVYPRACVRTCWYFGARFTHAPARRRLVGWSGRQAAAAAVALRSADLRDMMDMVGRIIRCSRCRLYDCILFCVVARSAGCWLLLATDRTYGVYIRTHSRTHHQ